MFSYYKLDYNPCKNINEFVDYYGEKYWHFVSEKEEEEVLKILSEGLNAIEDEQKLFKIFKWKTGINRTEKNENEHWILKTRRVIDITMLKNTIKRCKVSLKYYIFSKEAALEMIEKQKSSVIV